MTEDRRTRDDDLLTQDRLRDRLQQALPELAAEGPGPGATQAQLAGRLRRRRVVTGTVAVLFVVAGGVAVTQQVGDVQRVILDDGPEVVPQGSEGSAERSAGQGLDLQWSLSDGSLNPLPSVAVGPDGYLYALSTAPGVTHDDGTRDGHYPQAVYRSADGVDWEATSLDGIPPSYAVGVGDGVLYSLSTAPAGTEGPPGIATSADGGATWSLTELPVLPAPEMSVPLTPYTTVGGMAVGADQAVAFVRTSFYPQLGGLGEPPGQMTAAGVQQIDFEACMAAQGDLGAMTGRNHCEEFITSHQPWSDFGIESADDLLAQSIHVSGANGWERQPVEFGGGLVRGVTATADGFVAVAGGLHPIVDAVTPLEAWTSTDGRDWVLSTILPEATTEVIDVGTVDGHGVVVARDGWDPSLRSEIGGIAAWQRPDGGWTITDLATVVDQPGQVTVREADVGPLGVAVVVSQGLEVDPDEFDLPYEVPLGDPPMGSRLLLLTSRDGTTWQVNDLRAAVPEADVDNPRWVAVGPDSIALGIDTFTPRLTREDGVLLNIPREERGSVMTLVGTPTR